MTATSFIRDTSKDIVSPEQLEKELSAALGVDVKVVVDPLIIQVFAPDHVDVSKASDIISAYTYDAAEAAPTESSRQSILDQRTLDQLSAGKVDDVQAAIATLAQILRRQMS